MLSFLNNQKTNPYPCFASGYAVLCSVSIQVSLAGDCKDLILRPLGPNDLPVLAIQGHDPAQARLVFWERSVTTGVVEIPGGAHPSSCTPQYGFDVSHFKAYSAAAKDEAGFAGYVEKFNLNGTEEDYQAAVGGLDAIRSLPLPTY